jgi:hypothetical protein
MRSAGDGYEGQQLYRSQSPPWEESSASPNGSPDHRLILVNANIAGKISFYMAATITSQGL